MRPVVQLWSRVRLRGGEALVVAEVEIGFGAVVGDENFAVLIRATSCRDRRSGTDRTSGG